MTSYTFSADKLTEATERIAKANRRLAKAGITESFSFTTEAKIVTQTNQAGVEEKKEMVTLELSAPTISFGGWTFVARKAIREGRNVITDDTNLNPSVEAAWRKLAREEGADVQVVDLTNVPVATCIERDNKRKAEGQRFVGAEVINKMAERWLKK